MTLAYLSEVGLKEGITERKPLGMEGNGRNMLHEHCPPCDFRWATGAVFILLLIVNIIWYFTNIQSRIPRQRKYTVLQES